MKQELNDLLTLKDNVSERLFLEWNENNLVSVKERFREVKKEKIGLQQPSVNSQVKFGTAWADLKNIPNANDSSLS